MAPRDEGGMSLVGLVVVLGILMLVLGGLLFGLYNAGTSSNDLAGLTGSTSSTTSTTARPGGGPTSSTTTTTQRTVPGAALTAACIADYQAVSAAVAAYEATNATEPAAGSAWAVSAASGGPYLQSWPAGHGYTIEWTGSTVVVHPTHGTATAGPGSAQPPTGCYAH